MCAPELVDGAEDFRRFRQHDEQGARTDRACWLFDAQPSQVEVVIHPQSVIHSMVDYVDGSVIARSAIRTCARRFPMPWPGRSESIPAFRRWICSPSVAWISSAPTSSASALRLASQAAETGGSAPAMLNAANEVAVAAFLERRIRFSDIAVIIEDVLNRGR